MKRHPSEPPVEPTLEDAIRRATSTLLDAGYLDGGLWVRESTVHVVLWREDLRVLLAALEALTRIKAASTVTFADPDASADQEIRLFYSSVEDACAAMAALEARKP